MNENNDETTNDAQEMTVYLEIGPRTAAYVNVSLSWVVLFLIGSMVRDNLLACGVPFWGVALMLAAAMAGTWFFYRFRGDDE